MSGNEKRSQRLANEFRVRHDLGEGPVKDMFELAHAALGVDVISMDASEAEHGLTMTDPVTGTTVIAVATTPHPMRQRSSIAHEIGHVLAGDLDTPGWLTPGERSPEEIRADAFARHLLLPLAAIRRRHTKEAAIGPGDLSALIQEYEVSPHLAVIQLREAGLIPEATCSAWTTLSTGNLATRFGWLSQYRSLAADSQRSRAPQRLMTRAVSGYHHGVLGLTELALWYEQSPEELERQLMERAGLEASDRKRGPEERASDDWGDYWDTSAPLFPQGEAGSAS